MAGLCLLHRVHGERAHGVRQIGVGHALGRGGFGHGLFQMFFEREGAPGLRISRKRRLLSTASPQVKRSHAARGASPRADASPECATCFILKDDTMPDPLTDRLRAICLALPEAVEKEAWGDPIFRVRGKIFGMEKRGDGRVSLWCKAPAGSQMVLIGADPKRFFAPPYVGPKGWVGVRLDDGPDLRRGGRAGPPQLLA